MFTQPSYKLIRLSSWFKKGADLGSQGVFWEEGVGFTAGEGGGCQDRMDIVQVEWVEGMGAGGVVCKEGGEKEEGGCKVEILIWNLLWDSCIVNNLKEKTRWDPGSRFMFQIPEFRFLVLFFKPPVSWFPVFLSGSIFFMNFGKKNLKGALSGNCCQETVVRKLF